MDSHLINYFSGNDGSTIDELIESNIHDVSPIELLPCIYHLIAKGIFNIDYYNSFNETSRIAISTENNSDVLWNELLSTVKKTGFVSEIGE